MKRLPLFLLAAAWFAWTAEGGVTAGFSARDGITIKSGDRILSSGALFQVASPNWETRYFRLGMPNTIIDRTPDGGTMKCGSSSLDLKELSARVSGDSVTVTLRAEYSGKTPALYEFMPFRIPGGLTASAKYAAETAKGKKRSGDVPRHLELRGLVRISFILPAGTLTVETLDGKPFSLLDKRVKRYGNHPPQFIVMQSDRDLAPGSSIASRMKLTFVPAPESEAERVAPVSAPSVTAERRIGVPRFPLLPTPKVIKYDGGAGFTPGPSTTAVVKGGDGEGRLLRHIGRILGPLGFRAKAGDAPPAHGLFIDIGKGIPGQPDGYSLTVMPGAIRIEAAAERGAFYALQTLRGIERQGKFPAVTVKDWPDFQFRGLHTKSNSGTIHLFPQVLERVAAPLKLNAFVLECQYVRWDSLGGARHPRGMSKEEFVKLAAVAHENYIDFIPLQQTLSHNQWLFANGRNRELAEDPEAPLPYNYNVSDPRVYEILEKVFDEVLAASKSPYLHIGHDELNDWGRARFPHRPENVKLGAKELLRRDVMWHVDYARKNNVKLMLWHDVLVSKKEDPKITVGGAIGGTEQLRKTLPRDLVICVWSYKPRKEYRDVDLFLADGYQVIGCTWEHTPGNDRGNIGCFSRYVLDRPGMLGMLETTWSHFGTETMLNTHFYQVSAYVTAGAFFWNVRAGLDGNSPENTLLELLERPAAPKNETVASIPVAADTLLPQEFFDFDRLPEKLVTADGIVFPLAKAGLRTAALTGTPGQKFEVPLRNVKCDRLYLLGTLLESPSAHGLQLAKVRAVYADGGAEEFYLRSNTAVESFKSAPHFTDPDGRTSTVLYELNTPDAPYGYANRKSRSAKWPEEKPRRHLAPIVWNNPHPERPLAALEFSEFNPEYRWYLLALAAGTDQ